MKNTCPFYYMVFQVLKVLLIKICKMQPLDLLFFVVFISFYISRYHFSQIFRSSFNIIWKKDFRHKFSFFNGFTQIPILLTTKICWAGQKIFVDVPLSSFWHKLWKDSICEWRLFWHRLDGIGAQKVFLTFFPCIFYVKSKWNIVYEYLKTKTFS